MIAKLRANFKAKVLLPVLGFLVLAPMVTLWVVHSRETVQFERDTRKRLFTAEGIFKKHMAVRQRTLLSQNPNIAQSSAIKSVATLVHNASPETRESSKRTMKQSLADLREELTAAGSEVEAIVYSKSDGSFLEMSANNTSALKGSEFHAAAGQLIRESLEGEVRVGDLLVAGELLEIISIPVIVNEQLGPLGALTVGIRIHDAVAKEIGELTHSDLVFVANGQVVASTLQHRDAQSSLGKLMSLAGADAVAVLVNGEHFQALTGTMNREAGLGYVLLSSYEESLREVLRTQAALWLISLAGILISAGAVWLVISRATDPLRRLKDKVEAVGRGDFSKRLEVNRSDEVGTLARSFNEMTSNLHRSRVDLEKTVETLKSTQAQLVQREKLSAVGEFVAGVAHELNNPLTSLIGFAELLQMNGVNEKQATYLNFIVKSSQRCQKIVHSLLTFARQHPPERTLVHVSELIDTVLELLAYEMRTSNIEVVTRYDSREPLVLGDSHQLQQVILNILNNGRQAIEATEKPGLIRITTEHEDGMVRVTIADNGPGISAENLAKVFDPFFTTKPVGKGTGLGLSLCYGIIKEHAGVIQVASEPGAGATFTIELPVANVEEIPANDAGAKEARKLEAARGGKQILVIDDEEWILSLTRKVLEQEGYKVDVALNGDSALEAVERNRYDLLVVDQKMPGLSGTQLYQKLLLTQPDSAERLIFMTGDTVGESFQTFLKQTRKTCLTKPFSLKQLRTTIAEAIEG